MRSDFWVVDVQRMGMAALVLNEQFLLHVLK